MCFLFKNKFPAYVSSSSSAFRLSYSLLTSVHSFSHPNARPSTTRSSNHTLLCLYRNCPVFFLTRHLFLLRHLGQLYLLFVISNYFNAPNLSCGFSPLLHINTCPWKLRQSHGLNTFYILDHPQIYIKSPCPTRLMHWISYFTSPYRHMERWQELKLNISKQMWEFLPSPKPPPPPFPVWVVTPPVTWLLKIKTQNWSLVWFFS